LLIATLASRAEVLFLTSATRLFSGGLME